MRKIICIMIVLLISFLGGCVDEEYYESNDITRYEEYVDNVSFNNQDYGFFPNLDELPISVSLEMSYVERTDFMVRSKSLTLIINVSEENYATIKEEMMQKYIYLENPIFDDDDDYTIIPEVEFEYLSYTVFVVSNDEFNYPMNFGMIGYSDENSEIILLMFFDSDLDEISDIHYFMDKGFLLDELK